MEQLIVEITVFDGITAEHVAQEINTMGGVCTVKRLDV